MSDTGRVLDRMNNIGELFDLSTYKSGPIFFYNYLELMH